MSAAVTANRYEFRMPLPTGVRYGTLVTAISFGSISEFSFAIPAGNVVSNLAPVVDIGSDVSLSTGGQLNVLGRFTDEDSTSWTGIVDYGDGIPPNHFD